MRSRRALIALALGLATSGGVWSQQTPIDIIVPAGARHNLINTGTEPLKLYTLYGPPEHRDGVIHPTKADEAEEHFDGTTSE